MPRNPVAARVAGGILLAVVAALVLVTVSAAAGSAPGPEADSAPPGLDLPTDGYEDIVSVRSAVAGGPPADVLEPDGAEKPSTSPESSPVPLVDEVVLVDDDREECPTADWTGIQVAEQLADPGTAIAVCPGSYTETVTVTTPGVTIASAHSLDLPLLVPSVGEAPVVVRGDGVEDLNGDNGFTLEARAVTIQGLEIQGHQDVGILAHSLPGGVEARIVDNTLADNDVGFLGIAEDPLPGTDLLEANTVLGNRVGVDLRFDDRVTMRDNALAGNTYNFWARGIHHVDTSNTVDGRPIHYLVGASGATIDGNELDPSPGYVGLVNSIGVTVQNLNLSHNGQGVYAQGGTALSVENVTIETVRDGLQIDEVAHATVSDVSVTEGARGIQASPSTRATVGVTDARLAEVTHGVIAFGSFGWSNDRVSVTDTTIDADQLGVLTSRVDTVSVTQSQVDHSHVGILLAGDRVSSVEGTVEGTDVTTHPKRYDDGNHDGIVGFRSANVAIRDNTVVDGRYGIVSVDADASTIEANTVTGTHGALNSWRTPDDRITDNTATGNRFGLIAAGATPGLVVEDNRLTGNGNGTAVDATTGESSDSIEIANNTMRDNLDHGLLFTEDAGVDGVEVHDNVIAGNGGYGIDARRVVFGTLDARDNYWGSADGPSSPNASNPLADPVTAALADGAGDTVSGDSGTGVADVRFDPWLSQPPD
jgi:parallel beta-helix repeat protein